MKIVPFNKPKTIWEILEECTTAGILDKQKAEEMLDPLEEGQIRISAALLDTFCSDSTEQIQCHLGNIWGLLKLIAEGHIKESRFVQKKLKQMNFKTLSLMGELREQMQAEYYTRTTFDVFKKILLETSDKEIFKLAIVVTSMGEWCEELIEPYIIIGQNEEFSRYISYGFTHWITKESFKNAAFKLLELSRDWATVYLTQLLVEQQELLEDIQVQRNILVGALKNNGIQMEITVNLVNSLDLTGLFELAVEDRELFKQLVQLFNSLFFDMGIWEVLENNSGLLDTYIKNLETTKFDTLKLLGTKDVCRFIEDEETEGNIVEIQGQAFYNELKERALNLWRTTYSIALIKKSIKEGTGIYSWCSFIKEHQVVELIDTCKELYEQDKNVEWFMEDVLITIGDIETKRYIYKQLENSVNEEGRLVEKQQYTNVWGSNYKRENSILSKMKVIEELPFEEVVDFNMQLLEDYNPQIRSRAINSLYHRSEAIIKANKQLVVKIIERLGDSPFYIRNDALKLCQNKHIKITTTCAKSIEEKWKNQNQDNPEEFLKQFKEIQERIMSIVPPNKAL